MTIDKLIEKIYEKQNPSVMGLDPKLSQLPPQILEEASAKYGKTLKAAGEAIFTFNKGLIDACADLIPAVKPQSAYYEMYGIEGICALKKTVEYAKNAGLSVILDVKRNDIGTTAEAYAEAYLGETEFFGEKEKVMPADAVTVNPYLGTDGIEPFLKYEEGYIFVLIKTSNRSSGEIQNVLTENGKPLYFTVADKVKEWGSSSLGSYHYNAAGAVVGATYPEELKLLRDYLPETFFLIPGYGAQGGGAKEASFAFDNKGLGAIVNSSRGIMYAYKSENDPQNYQIHARNAVIAMKNDLLSEIGKITLS